MGIVSTGFSITNFIHAGWAGENHFSFHTVSGILAAIPFAIWFFLAIEGAAMAAEEVKNPKKTIPIAYIAGIFNTHLISYWSYDFCWWCR
jgi:ethanolamine permease